MQFMQACICMNFRHLATLEVSRGGGIQLFHAREYRVPAPRGTRISSSGPNDYISVL